MWLSMPLQYAGDPQTIIAEAVALEKAGLDAVWVAEAYGFDSPTLLGYLAARTERLQIGAGILDVHSRTPALLAQTAAGLDAVSGGRALLGLGASGPQVIEGWLPLFFLPERAKETWGAAMAEGRKRRPAELGELQIAAGGTLAIGEDRGALRDLARPQLALCIGGMGSKGKNFYNDLVSRYGFAKEARLIQDLYLSGRKKEAEAAVPDELIDLTNLVGPEGFVRERVAAYREAGVTMLNVTPIGSDPAALIEKVRSWL